MPTGAGWQELAAQAIDLLNARQQPVVFMLWGKQAQATGKSIDRNRHCVIETAHPSPLAHGAGRNTGSSQLNPSSRLQTGWRHEECPPLTGICKTALVRLTAGTIDKAGSYRIGKQARLFQGCTNIKSSFTW
jgi:hypothetical protein